MTTTDHAANNAQIAKASRTIGAAYTDLARANPGDRSAAEDAVVGALRAARELVGDSWTLAITDEIERAGRQTAATARGRGAAWFRTAATLEMGL